MCQSCMQKTITYLRIDQGQNLHPKLKIARDGNNLPGLDLKKIAPKCLYNMGGWEVQKLRIVAY